MPKKKKAEEEVYHVEVITKARVSEEGEWEYLVKWAGYHSDADSWEPTENVQQCDRLLQSFWSHVGMDNDDYPIGHEITAKEDWINKEKRYFSETFVKPSKRKSGKVTKKDVEEKGMLEPNASHTSESSMDDVQSSDEGPSTKIPNTKKQNRKTRVVDTESDSESDGRLLQVKSVSHPRVTTLPSRVIPKIPARIKRPQLPSTTGGPLSIAPPRVTAVRTHQDQRANPLVKSLSLPSKSVEAGSLLPTKQRVASGILPPPSGPKSLPPVPRKPLPSFSFKKNKPPAVSTSQVKDTANIPTLTSASSVDQSKVIGNDANVAASPQPMDVDGPLDLFDAALNDAGPLGGSSDACTVTVPIPPKSQSEINAERFLQTVNIPLLSGPLEIATASDQHNQPMIELSKTPAISKIPKKWKWSGDLFINTSESKTELLCSVTISDPTGTSNSSHINLLLSPLNSLQISRLYPIMDLSFLLRACGKPQFFGRLESAEVHEKEITCGLEQYMVNEGLVAIVPLLLDGTEAAVLAVFSKAQQNVTKTLHVPEQLLSEAYLLLVLLPFSVSAMKSSNAAGWGSIETVMQSSATSQDISVPVPQEAMLHQAMSLLCFPKTLLDFLNNSSTNRAYCIWPLPNQLSPGLDTIMLQYVLKSTKAGLVKPEGDARVIFISNRHLKILHTMPSLVMKYVNSPEVQFWTYGYSPDMTYDRWKLQEVYPLGGVVTFTSLVLAEDLMGCLQLMSQIIEHPLWDCYLIPEVLAVSHQLYKNTSSSSVSHLDPVLDLINLGLVSVTRMLEKGHSNQVAWLSQVFSHSITSGPELLETYLKVLRSHPATLSMTTEQLVSFTNNEIIKDLSSAQIQPALMDNYRRFTVIRAASEDSIPFDNDGLEWSSVSLFSFKDDYFQP